MVDKVVLNNLSSLQNETTAIGVINANNAAITTAMNKTLSRDGTSPNQMSATLDMNSNQILNLPQAATDNSPLRYKDLNTFLHGGTISNIPAGGVTGNQLLKNSNADYDVSWGSNIVFAGLNPGTLISIVGSNPATISVDVTAAPTWTGLHTFSHSAGGQNSANFTGGPVLIQPSGSSQQGLFVNYATVTGAPLADLNLNNFVVATDDVNVATGNVRDVFVLHNFGGANAKGGRAPLAVTMQNTGVTSTTNLNRNYVAGSFNNVVATSDIALTGTPTGTSTSSTGTGGNFFGINVQAQQLAAAKGITNICANEIDIGSNTGSSGWVKQGLAIVGLPSNVFGTHRWECLLNLSDASGSTGWPYGLVFSNINSQFPFSDGSAGSVSSTMIGTINALGAVSLKASHGVDFSGVTFGTDAFKSTGFVVSPTGGITGTTGSFTDATDSTSTTTGAVQATGGLLVKKNLTVNAGIFPGTSTFQPGGRTTAQIYSDASHGLILSGQTGSTYDFFLASAAGGNLITNLTGTTNVNICTNDSSLPSGRAGMGTNAVTSTLLKFAPATTTYSQINLTVGGPPTTPVDGDIWLESNTNTGLKIRINGVTKSVTLA